MLELRGVTIKIKSIRITDAAELKAAKRVSENRAVSSVAELLGTIGKIVSEKISQDAEPEKANVEKIVSEKISQDAEPEKANVEKAKKLFTLHIVNATDKEIRDFVLFDAVNRYSETNKTNIPDGLQIGVISEYDFKEYSDLIKWIVEGNNFNFNQIKIQSTSHDNLRSKFVLYKYNTQGDAITIPYSAFGTRKDMSIDSIYYILRVGSWTLELTTKMTFSSIAPKSEMFLTFYMDVAGK